MKISDKIASEMDILTA